jgi:hypothetical protein
MTTGSLPSITATHEFVVPRSMPIIFPVFFDILLTPILAVFFYTAMWIVAPTGQA